MSAEAKLSIYLPDLSHQQLASSPAYTRFSGEVKLQEISDWQFELCRELGDQTFKIPWNLLRAQQFELPDEINTAVCCDPILMQMTHRGAYLWGQEQINFSKEEVIGIIAQINQQLMREGESFYMLNEKQWLYVNKEAKQLGLDSFENSIGKDRFGFSYPGKDGVFWDQLATEIQMLIKQMIDYQGLTAPAPEMMINVHFSGNTQASIYSEKINFARSNVQVLTNSLLFETFCNNNGISSSSLNDFDTNNIDTNIDSGNYSNKVIVFSSSHLVDNESIIAVINDYALSQKFSTVRVVTQNGIANFLPKKSLIQRVKSLFQ
jgi:hypothetical protein